MSGSEKTMPHRIDMDSIHEELFLLLNLAYASPAYAQQHRGVFQVDDESGDDEYYVPWLRYIISEKLLIVATKIRVIMDMLQEEQDYYAKEGEDAPFDLAKLQRQAVATRHVGEYFQGNGTCDLRDCCNRLIHANDVLPVVTPSRDVVDSEGTETNAAIRYWNGFVTLLGERGGIEWAFTLCVPDFCLAMEQFLSLIESEVDWHKMYKYDNLL